MAEHVRGPTRGGAIDRMHPPQRAAAHNLLRLLVMLAVAMLMADDRLDTAFVQRLLDLQPLGAGHRHRFLERNQLRAALDAEFDELQAQIWQRAEEEKAGLEFLRRRRGVRAGFGIPDLGRRRFQPTLVYITNADDFETGVGMKGGAVVQSTLAHADNDDSVLVHKKEANDERLMTNDEGNPNDEIRRQTGRLTFARFVLSHSFVIRH